MSSRRTTGRYLRSIHPVQCTPHAFRRMCQIGQSDLAKGRAPSSEVRVRIAKGVAQFRWTREARCRRGECSLLEQVAYAQPEPSQRSVAIQHLVVAQAREIGVG